MIHGTGKNNIDIHLGTEITQVDPARKIAVAKAGESFTYDKLLLATGGISFVPPIKGVPASGVFSLRTIDDANAIKERAKKQKDWCLSAAAFWGLKQAMVCENWA